jgi:tetratricopeptide (TPR) repeat protein
MTRRKHIRQNGLDKHISSTWRFLPFLHSSFALLVRIAAVTGLLLSPGARISQAQQPAHSADSTLLRQVQQAARLAEQGNPQEAMRLAANLLERHPDFAPAVKLKAMLLEESGQDAEAAETYERALKLAPRDPDLLLKTGVYRLKRGNYEQAIEVLGRCARILPRDGDVQFYLAQAYHLNGQDKPALAALERSLKAEPGNAPVMQKYGEILCSTGDNANGLRWLEKAQAADPKLPHLNYDLGWANYNLVNLPEAIPYFASELRLHPKDPNSLKLLAESNAKLQRWQEARDAYQRLLSAGNGSAEQLQGLGHCELELKDYPAAIEHLQAALRLDPTELLARFYLSRAYAAVGKTEDAQREADLHRLMMEQMTFVRSQANEQRESAIVPQARQLLKDHREDAALRLFQEHFKGSAATLGDAYVFAGKLYLFLGNHEDGLRCLHHALQIEPTVRGARTDEGILDLKEAQLDKAEAEFKAELANDPNYQTAIAELGEVRYRQGRWSEAAEQLAKSHTSTPELLCMLSDSYFHLGKMRDANLAAELAAAYGRNNPELMRDLGALLESNGQRDTAQRLSASLAR